MTKRNGTAGTGGLMNNNSLIVSVAAGDDSGGFGIGHEKIVYALTETSMPEEFANIAKTTPWNTRGRSRTEDELSFYSSSDDIRAEVLRQIANLEVAIYISTEANSPDRTEKSVKRYRRLIEETVKEMLINTNAYHIVMYLDDTSMLRGDAGKKIITSLAKKHGKTAEIKQVRSQDEPLIQTQDFVAGSVLHPDLFNIVKNKVMYFSEK